MMISRLSSGIWPVSAMSALDNDTRRRAGHQARADTPKAGPPVPDGTDATISDGARALLAAEQNGARIIYAPVHPVVAAYNAFKK